jgi:hypothetical protein
MTRMKPRIISGEDTTGSVSLFYYAPTKKNPCDNSGQVLQEEKKHNGQDRESEGLRAYS